jgi:hypothetical protein
LRLLAKHEDGASVRYAVFNTAVAERKALDERIEAIRARLGYELVAI